jgi:hypothetical protein
VGLNGQRVQTNVVGLLAFVLVKHLPFQSSANKLLQKLLFGAASTASERRRACIRHEAIGLWSAFII